MRIIRPVAIMALLVNLALIVANGWILHRNRQLLSQLETRVVEQRLWRGTRLVPLVTQNTDPTY